jgi:hypothetical protein
VVKLRIACSHLTEEMTERYSSVAQAEVEAALGKVVSLAGYRGLLRRFGGGKKRERDIGFEPATFSSGMRSGGIGRGSSR